jgi:oxygen-dependent protoporphyrinogen oxidase
MTPIGRRIVLKAAAAAAVTAACPGASARLWAGERPTAVVIGSGIAGLSAAYDLQTAGFAVIVLEKNNIAGGRMIEAWMGPLFGAVHASALFEGSKEMWALAHEVGRGGDVDGQPDGDIWGFPVDNGHAVYTVATRLHLTELLNVPGLSAETKGRLWALFPELAEIRSEVDPCLLATGARWDRESLWDYCARTLGEQAAREIMDYWLEPALLWPWNWNAMETSMIAPLAIVAQQEKRWVRPRSGIGFLTRELAKRLDVRLNTTVMRVSAADASGRHTVHFLTPEGERRATTPDVVLCAIQGDFVMPIMEGLDSRQQDFFARIHTTKYAIVQYILKPDHAPKAPAGGPAGTRNHPDAIKRRLAFGWSVQPARPDRPAVASFSLSQSEEERWRASGQSLPDYCLPLAQSLYPSLQREAIADVVVRAGDNLAQMPTGFVRAIAAFLEGQERQRRGLYFAGEYLGNSFTGGACASGRTVARTVIRHWI